MTEAEWDRTEEFRRALWEVSGPPTATGRLGRTRSWFTGRDDHPREPSHRKLLLALAAIGRRLWAGTGHGSADGHQEWADRCERYADDRRSVADLAEMSRADRVPMAMPAEYMFYLSALRCPGPAGAATRERAGDLWGRLPLLTALVGEYFPERSPAGCHTLREVFGNPFRPVTFAPSWRTSTAVALASGMYASRDFSALPILADALQDAGCDRAEVLSHCRGEGPHVRGCWVVDSVLGKG